MKFSHLALTLGLSTLIAALPAQAGTRLDKIKETKTIYLGYTNNAIPFSYVDSENLDNQTPMGYSIDVCKDVVEQLSKSLNEPLKVAYYPVTHANRLLALADNRIDLLCSDISNTQERQKMVNFSPAIFITSIRFVTLAKSPIVTLEDLKGKNVTSTAGTRPLAWLSKTNQDLHMHMNIIPAQTLAQGFNQVTLGKADAYFMDDVLLSGFIANSQNPQDYRISGELYSDEPYALALPKEDSELQDLVNQAIDQIIRSGRLESYYTKWFEQPIPPKNINLNLPASKAFQDLIQHPDQPRVAKDYE
ncbi:hypothetical protein IX83_01070 [Basilea psittacipulmonis DSM 24701]|uniref:Solute-binding protein family 3/N-terminal domain-containing protein n=2 Tax=Basilea TaxID=1472344 RepID=A0A077DB42_9BURK|nr:hypothetical protein IX83_01070 [Basilea psittacipulmonis DSM 24701]